MALHVKVMIDLAIEIKFFVSISLAFQLVNFSLGDDREDNHKEHDQKNEDFVFHFFFLQR